MEVNVGQVSHRWRSDLKQKKYSSTEGQSFKQKKKWKGQLHVTPESESWML